MDKKRNLNSVVKLLNKLYYGKSRSLGEILAQRKDQQVSLPLKSVEIDARVSSRFADVTIRQSFKNCYRESLEAVYTFPVSASASIYSVDLKVGERTVKGKIQERSEARKQYQEALDSGKRACLMEQERDEIFTVSLGNIQPDETLEVEIKYCEILSFFEDGSTELRLPLVVAPRYVGGEPVAREQVGDGVSLDSDRVPDASRISPPRLAEDFDPEVDLRIDVTFGVDSKNSTNSRDDLKLKNLACSQHATRLDFEEGGARVSLANKKELMNRDFILRWTVAESGIACRFNSFSDDAQKTKVGMLSILPEVSSQDESDTTRGRDLIFLLDRSGSMMGAKMLSAKRACKYLLSSLGPADRFAINAFDHQNSWFFGNRGRHEESGDTSFVESDEEAVAAALDFLTQVDASGGTEICSALGEALERFEKTDSDRVPVIVLLTDGQVGDESHVFKLLQKSDLGIRIFSLGIDTAVNYGFLKHLSELSGGVSYVVEPGSDLEDSMRKIASDIGEPVVTKLRIRGLNCKVEQSSIAPLMVPDLFSGRSVDIFFRYESGGATQADAVPVLIVEGEYQDGRKFKEEVLLGQENIEAIGKLWARRVIQDLEDRFRAAEGGFGWGAEKDVFREAIVDLSVECSILSRFTAFTVVDEEEIQSEDLGLRKTYQPVHNPLCWGASVPGSTGAGGWGAAGFDSFSGSMSGAWGAPPPPACGTTGGGYAMTGGLGLPQPEAPPTLQQPEPCQEDSFSIESKSNSFGFSDMAKSEGATKSSGTSEFKGLSRLSIASPEKLTGPLMQVVVSLDKFVLAWTDFWNQVEQGEIPAVDTVVIACEELRNSLDDHPVAYEMPKISTIISLNYRSLLAAMVAPSLTVAGLRAMRKQLDLGFDDALAEAEATLTRALGKNGAFWQFTV